MTVFWQSLASRLSLAHIIRPGPAAAIYRDLQGQQMPFTGTFRSTAGIYRDLQGQQMPFTETYRAKIIIYFHFIIKKKIKLAGIQRSTILFLN